MFVFVPVFKIAFAFVFTAYYVCVLYEGPALTVNFPLVRALRSGLKSNSKVFIATQRPRVEAMEESIFLLVSLAEM